MGLMKNKKGMFFTLSAILLVVFLFVSYSSNFRGSPTDNQYSENNRIESMNSFLGNLEKEASIALYTSSFRSIIAMLDEVSSTGTYISDVQDAAEELVVNGSLDGSSVFIMENNTLVYWNSKMQEQAQKIGIDLSLSFENISVGHKDPWTVEVNTTMKGFLRDVRDVAYWNMTFEVHSELSILNLEDPLFIVNTGNKVGRRIVMSPFYRNFSSASDVETHSQNGYYIEFSDAPSYLDRLEGKTNSNSYGIESLVDKAELAKHIAIDEDKTNVDYIYFSTYDPTAYPVMGMGDHFKIDNVSSGSYSHIEEYNLSSLVP